MEWILGKQIIISEFEINILINIIFIILNYNEGIKMI